MTEEAQNKKKRPAKTPAGKTTAGKAPSGKTTAGKAPSGAARKSTARAAEEGAAPDEVRAAAGEPAADEAAQAAPTVPAADAAGTPAEAAPGPDAPHAGEASAAGEEGESAGGGERSLTDEERAELYRRQLKELRLLDVARDMMLTLVTVGYQKLGLTSETRDLRDLPEAHLAIELLRGILRAIDGVAGAEEMETYRSTLAQMQLNYARVAGEG